MRFIIHHWTEITVLGVLAACLALRWLGFFDDLGR